MIAWAIEALVASTILMLIVLAVREPVRRSFGPEIAYALWMLPVARLFLPPLPAEWGLGRLFGAGLGKLAEQHVAAGVVNPAVMPANIIEQAVMTATMKSAAGQVDLALVPPVSTPGGAPIGLLIAGFWIIGAVAFIVYHLFRHSAFCARLLRHARPSGTQADAPVRVVETDGATGPLAFGVWRKYVVFPGDFQDRYDEDERDLALAHELTHHARGDLIANWIALVVLAIHWFNPVAWRAFRAFRADQEMACDARVLAGRDPAFRHAYGRAIVKSAHGGAVSAACHLHTINELKGRLKMLSTGRKSRARIAGGAISVIALTFAGLGLTASGTQAAERLRTRVTHSIGVDITSLDAAAPSAPSASAAPGATDAQQPPAVGAVPVPPSSAASPAAPAPDAPTTPAHPGTYVEPPVAPAAPAAPAGTAKQFRTVLDGSADDARVVRNVRIITRDKNGEVVTDDVRGVPDAPQVTAGKCPTTGDPKEMTVKGEKGGKRFVIICTDRIERVSVEATKAAVNVKDIQRHALAAALDGLRTARASVSQPDAIKGIDQAIAEVEQEIAHID